jgi:hypothetical protein
METASDVVDPDEWVRTCREHNRICTVTTQRNRPWWPSRVWCPAEGGHVLILDFMWKVTRRSRPAARGWSGWKDGEGSEP